VHEQDQVSTTDPDSTYATKGGTPARLGYYDNYLVDNDSCVIVGVQATAARMSQETVAAEDMLTRFAEWQEREPESVGADTTYGNGEFLQWLADRNITPYMRTRDSIHRKRSPFFGPERFTYEPEHVVFPMFGNNVAIPSEHDGNREERLCIRRFGLTEQMCRRFNQKVPFTTSGTEGLD